MIALLPLGCKKFQIFRFWPMDYVGRQVWTWVINRATSPSNSFCSTVLLNNSHVFVLFKRQPLLHDFSSIVSCAYLLKKKRLTQLKGKNSYLAFIIYTTWSSRWAPALYAGQGITDLLKLGMKISRHLPGAPNVNFRKISVLKTIWDLEFSEHLL